MRTLFFLSIVFTLSVAYCLAQESYIVVERYSKKVLLASGTEYKRPVASLAHMLTAKVVLDWAKVAGVSSSTRITVPRHTFDRQGLNPLNLQAGDQLSVRDALYATILSEDAVSSYTLAHHVGMDLLARRRLAGAPVDLFVSEMNNLARSLGMGRTSISSPVGADLWQKNNYSTASDLARLSVNLVHDNAYGFYAKQKQRNLSVLRADGRMAQVAVINSNKLLSKGLKVEGLKSGFSQQAGHCVSISVDHESYLENLADGRQRVTPVQLIVIVLGSSDAQGLAQRLIPQGWSHYENWRNSGYMASPNRREFLKVSAAN